MLRAYVMMEYGLDISWTEMMTPHQLIRQYVVYFWVWLLSCTCVALAFGSSVNVPLDHWSYRHIDTLIGFGLIDTAMLGTKPFSRDEMARLIAEALPRHEDLPYRQRVVAKRLLTRLLRAFQDEVNAQIGTQDAAPSTFLKPFADGSAQYVYLDGQPTRMLPESAINATEGTPLLRNNEGITYRAGQNLRLTASSYAKLWEHFSFFVQPLVLLRPDSAVEADFRLHKGYLKASLGPVELEFGRDSIWWGQGDRGTLIFSNHARPLEFVQLALPHPVQLPWIFRPLGLFKANAMVSVLEDDRDHSRAKLAGLRMQIKPLSWLELGVVAGVQFDGAGVPGLNFQDVLQLLSFQNPGGDQENPTNQLIALDFRLTVPFLRYTQIYFEYGGEDAKDFSKPPTIKNGGGLELLFKDVAYLLGVYVPRLTNDGRTTFRFEWMQNDFANGDEGSNIWYTHPTYTSGFTFHRRILGHAAGGDGGEFFGRLTRELTNRVTLGGDFAYQWRGDVLLNNADVTGRKKEKQYSGGVDVQYFITNQWQVQARFAMRRIDHFNLQPDVDRTDLIFWVNIRFYLS